MTLADIMAAYPEPPSPQSDMGRAFAGVRAGQRLLAAVDLALFRARQMRTGHGAMAPDVVALLFALEMAAADAMVVLGTPEPRRLPAGVEGLIARGCPDRDHESGSRWH